MTLDAFLALPETKPAREFIDGQIIQKPMPKGKHSAIQTDLAPAINAIVRSPKIARAFNELRCSFGDDAIVPDISIFVWDRISREVDGSIANTFSAAPDWAIEILSPGQSGTKVTKKLLHCLKYGTQMGWLIDPEERSVLVYLSDQTITIYDQPAAQLPVPTFAKGVILTVETLFDFLQD